MNLARLSLLSVAGSILGLLLLLAVAVHSYGDLQARQARVRELVALTARIDAFSADSDALLINRPDSAVWKAFLDEAEAIRQTLSAMSGEFPAARRAERHVDEIVKALKAARQASAARTPRVGPPLSALPSRMVMNQVAGYGVALDGAVGELLRQRQTRIARDTNGIAISFAAAAAAFGIFCIVAFGLILKRVNGPVRALTSATRRIEAGEHDVRVPESGSDEFAELSRTFNRMVDKQAALVETLSNALATQRTVINSLPAQIALLDDKGKIRDVNDQWRHFGISNHCQDPSLGIGSNYLAVCRAAEGDQADEALEAADGLQSVLAGDRDAFVLEYPCHAPDELRWFRMMASRPAASGRGMEGAVGAVVMHVDITERKLAEQELERVAYFDPLTGLANRMGFLEAFSQHIDRDGWNPRAVMIIVDIREMRDVNDTHGYEVGDQLLISMARRLEDRFVDDALVGRLGGDQFILCLVDGPARPTDGLDEVAEIFRQPVPLSEAVIELSVRGGYTLLGDEQRSAETLLHEVEVALHENRSQDSSEFHCYDRMTDRIARQRIDLTRDLRRALQEDQFELHFQPKVDLQTGRMIACEALIRWIHPERGMQMPDQFIPVAEQSQLIGPIGDWVLFQACRHLREWQDAGLELVSVSVNVSVQQLRRGGFTRKVREALDTHSIDPAALTLEITESVFSEESATLRRQLRDLHGLGVRLSLDDFGTGYSSLLYLQLYPFDEIKIDKGFVQGLLAEPFNRNIVSMILAISRMLGADSVAEGLDSPGVRDVLIDLGCRMGQGFYYSMPLEAEDFGWLLERHSRLPLPPPPDVHPDLS